MVLIALMFICAFALSGIAAFYSVAGLIAIFAAAPIPIAVMGSVLEGSKLVVASWLYRNWPSIPKIMKVYFTVSLVILMFLTSMGIFGFLSKAHLEQSVPTGEVSSKLSIIDEKIKSQKENINAARQTLSQLDQQVNQTISRTADATDTKAVDRSIAIRKQQAKERATLAKEIETAQADISKLNEERAPIAAELRKVEAEVGPIKYIAALVYGDEANTDTTLLEKAVRWVTILIVIVFDPLAVIMLIAANWSVANRNNTPPNRLETPPETPSTKEPDPVPPTEDDSQPMLERYPYLNGPFVHFKNLKPMVSSMVKSDSTTTTERVEDTASTPSTQEVVTEFPPIIPQVAELPSAPVQPTEVDPPKLFNYGPIISAESHPEPTPNQIHRQGLR